MYLACDVFSKESNRKAMYLACDVFGKQAYPAIYCPHSRAEESKDGHAKMEGCRALGFDSCVQSGQRCCIQQNLSYSHSPAPVQTQRRMVNYDKHIPKSPMFF